MPIVLVIIAALCMNVVPDEVALGCPVDDSDIVVEAMNLSQSRGRSARKEDGDGTTTVVSPKEMKLALRKMQTGLFQLEDQITRTRVVMRDDDLAFLDGMLSVVVSGMAAMIDFLKDLEDRQPKGTPKVRSLYPRGG